MSISSAEQALKGMGEALRVGDNQRAAALLSELKDIIIGFDALPPLGVESPSAQQERVLARRVYENAVLLAVREGDTDGFQRYVSSLRPYYSGYGPEISESELKNEIIGLNLLFLIVENRMADFHSELELLSESMQQQPSVAFCAKLDQLLMVGSYDQVMSAAAHPPCESYSFFLVKLLRTVRTNIGECAAASYRTLTVAAASEMLMFSSSQVIFIFYFL
jgi:26S proteasome regulatory subunit N12